MTQEELAAIEQELLGRIAAANQASAHLAHLLVPFYRRNDALRFAIARTHRYVEGESGPIVVGFAFAGASERRGLFAELDCLHEAFSAEIARKREVELERKSAAHKLKLLRGSGAKRRPL